MSEEPWRIIYVLVEPLAKEFRVGVEEVTNAGEVVETLVNRVKDEGVDLTRWGQERVGQPNIQLMLMRKSAGNQVMPPEFTFGQLEPALEADERFKLDAQAIVG